MPRARARSLRRRARARQRDRPPGHGHRHHARARRRRRSRVRRADQVHGPVYDEGQAQALATERGWVVKPDGDRWRRVVPSPDPKRIIQLGAIRSLVDGGFLVVCVGGGGVPVIADGNGHAGIEAVIDKDLASALLAVGLAADVLVLATDVDAVFTGWGTEDQRPVDRATPAWLRAQSFAGGSMGPKVEAVCRFVEATGKRAAIGRLEELPGLVDGTAGTQVRA